MSFEFDSYNSLYVPLDIGTWQCQLLLRNDYEQQARRRKIDRERERRDRWYSSTMFDWRSDLDDAGDSDERRRELDQRTFQLHFRPNYDIRRTISADIDAITSFLSDHLNVPHWKLPTDNAGIESTLKQAVTNGQLVPIVDRDRRNPAQTSRPNPSPLYWPQIGGGGFGRAVQKVLTGAEFDALRAANGEIGSVASSRSGGGLGLMAVVEPLFSSALASGDVTDGIDDSAVGDTATVDEDSFSTDNSTPLSNASPFEYGDNPTTSDNVQDQAARGVSEGDEAECFSQYERDMDECTAYRSAMGGQRFMDSCSQQAFQNYQQCRGY